MKIREFWVPPKMDMDDVSPTFFNIGAKFARVIDGETDNAVFTVSYNADTGWVQLLIDDNAPPSTVDQIDDAITKFSGLDTHLSIRKMEGMPNDEPPREISKQSAARDSR